MSAHLQTTKSNTFKYRRKVPNQLKPYINKAEIIKSLGKNQLEATTTANDFNRLIEEALEITSISSIPEQVKLDLIKDKLSPIVSINSIKEAQRDLMSELAQDYLNSLSVSQEEVQYRSYILLELFPSIFNLVIKNKNPKINEVSYNHLVKARDILKLMPKRNIQKYRDMSLDELLRGLTKGTIKTTSSELISTTTLNKQIKWLNALMNFAVKHKVLKYNPMATSITIKRKSISRNERKSLTKEELDILEDDLKQSKTYPILNVLRYTGMRLSELYKYKLNTVDGVLCFDLREPKGDKPLKTISSYRIIPVHDKLVPMLDKIEVLLEVLSTDYLSKRFKKDFNRLLEDTDCKSLYSLRHTFATNLIANGVQPEIVSELMGHAHSTMTMNRYVKGYPVEVLKEAIDCL